MIGAAFKVGVMNGHNANRTVYQQDTGAAGRNILNLCSITRLGITDAVKDDIEFSFERSRSRARSLRIRDDIC